MDQIELQHNNDAILKSNGDQSEIISLLKRQNELLNRINNNLAFSMERENEKRYTVRTRITDLDMSIGAMVSFMFKWLIASIPVGIIVGIVWFFLVGILMASR